MKLKNIWLRLKEDIDANAIASSNSILLMQHLKDNPKFMNMLSDIQMPTDKYKAIIYFANLLGIPEE